MTVYADSTDQELMGLLRAEDERAFTEIYRRYWKTLYHTAHNIIQNPEYSQDAVQEVFISLWQRKNDVNIHSLKAYLHQAVRFRVLKAIRMQQTDNHFYQRLAEVTTDLIADNPLLFKEQQQLLKELINTLPVDCREAFYLSREENLTYKQIAVQLNVSEKTVEKRLSKSLKYLRTRLNYEMCLAILFIWKHF